jgi:hypothetical protein
VAVCTVAPAACVSRSGLFAIGVVVAPPAADVIRISTPPSTLAESTTTQDPEVNPVPSATVSTVAPWVFAAPVAVVLGAPSVN